MLGAGSRLFQDTVLNLARAHGPHGAVMWRVEDDGGCPSIRPRRRINDCGRWAEHGNEGGPGWPCAGIREALKGGYLCAGRMVNFVGGVAGWPVLDGEHSILVVGMMLSSIKGGDLPEKGMDRCFRCRAGMRAWEGGRRQSWRHAGCRRGRHWGHCGPRGAEEGSGRAAGLGGA